MATQTEDKTKTRDQVRELLDSGVESAEVIAEKLGKTKATIYVHIRNIKAERGQKPRGRGRPPKVEGSKPATKTTQTRSHPPKGDSPKQTATAEVASNGSTPADRFPAIKTAIEAELAAKRQDVTVLEGMLSALSS